MSIALFNKGGLRFWTEEEITNREIAIKTLHETLSKHLLTINSAWQFERTETPTIIPKEYLSSAYSGDDVFFLETDNLTMRPETTAGSYLYAEHLLKSGKKKLPLCVWQAGKSYRQESNDGASASKLRFNEFWQAEWQCVYRADSKADYRATTILTVAKQIALLTNCEARIVSSDRLPAYSQSTLDIEVLRPNDKWTEMASVSIRTDFAEVNPNQPLLVLEVAVGVDRVVSVMEEKKASITIQ